MVVAPADVLVGFLGGKKSTELPLCHEFVISPISSLTLKRGKGLLKGRRESNGAVIKQTADLNALIDA